MAYSWSPLRQRNLAFDKIQGTQHEHWIPVTERQDNEWPSNSLEYLSKSEFYHGLMHNNGGAILLGTSKSFHWPELFFSSQERFKGEKPAHEKDPTT
jgi:hypothetical protein